jgi:glyoxylase-like metal-dependent hydrolase (beta-lactamase superfamily II)
MNPLILNNILTSGDMKRRAFIQSSSVGISAIALPSWLSLPECLNWHMQPLRRNVGVFTEKGGTIGWLIQPNGIVVIDSQWKEQAGHLIDEIQKRQTGPVSYLINTHHHGDHTSGNIAFKDVAKKILAHENSKINQMNSARRNQNEADQLYPNQTYTDRWQETIGDEFIDIQYWGPAHTNGDSIIHFQHANIVHCGDLVFNRRYPYIDKPAGAMIDNWINVLQQLQSYFDNETIFIFGHAREGFQVTGGKDDLAAFADYLTAVLEFVGSGIKEGKSQDQIMQATSIPGAPEWQGDGIQRSLSAAFEELTSASKE